MFTVCLLLLFLLSCDAWELWSLAAAIIAHELGHLIALRLCEVSFRGLTLGEAGPLIGCGALSSSEEELFVALMGPLSGILWAALASCLPFPHREQLAGSSVLMSLFNLLPVPDSDGGRILLALGCGEKRLRRIGILLLGALMGICLWKRFLYSALAALRLLLGCLFNQTPSEAP